MGSGKGAGTEPVWSDGKATGNKATREAIGLRVEADGAFYFCLQSSPEDTPELTGALEADMRREQVEGMLRAVRVPLERRWPFAEEPATHAVEAESVHYQLRAPWGIVHEHDLPDKQVFVTVHDRKDQEWLSHTLEEALRVMAKHPRKQRPTQEPLPDAIAVKRDSSPMTSPSDASLEPAVSTAAATEDARSPSTDSPEKTADSKNDAEAAATARPAVDADASTEPTEA